MAAAAINIGRSSFVNFSNNSSSGALELCAQRITKAVFPQCRAQDLPLPPARHLDAKPIILQDDEGNVAELEPIELLDLPGLDISFPDNQNIETVDEVLEALEANPTAAELDILCNQHPTYSISDKDSSGASAIAVAIKTASLGLFRAVLQKEPRLANSLATEFYTPLGLIAFITSNPEYDLKRSEKVAMAELLITTYGAQVNQLMRRFDGTYFNALQIASITKGENKPLDLVELLVESGGEIYFNHCLNRQMEHTPRGKETLNFMTAEPINSYHPIFTNYPKIQNTQIKNVYEVAKVIAEKILTNKKHLLAVGLMSVYWKRGFPSAIGEQICSFLFCSNRYPASLQSLEKGIKTASAQATE